MEHYEIIVEFLQIKNQGLKINEINVVKQRVFEDYFI